MNNKFPQIANVWTGEIEDVRHYEETPSYAPGKVNKTFRTPSGMTPKGAVDRRTRAHNIGVSYTESYTSGRYAITTPETEVKATVVRAEIQDLEARLLAAKKALIDIYNGGAK